ncbi:MAG TPA: helix-turn-helix domain-containing protein [Paenisporosarcina sp.]|nr:helix-turn-helix domain-containing protein [Paenisporosarcina sp.]
MLKNGKAKAIQLSILEAICMALECQPGDILEYKSEEDSQR